MPIRTSMQDIVDALRQYGQAADDDVFREVNYWSDEQLQDIADLYSQFGQARLERQQVVGSTLYAVVIPKMNFMEDDFIVYDASKTEIATMATYSQTQQLITFASNLDTSKDYFVEARFIRFYDALSDLWEQKAAQRFDYIDFKAGNNKMNMKQEYDHCMERAAYYRNRTMRRFPRQRGKWTPSTQF